MPNIRRLALVSILLPCTAFAKREVSIREFSESIRSRIEEKVSEALNSAAAAKAEISGVVTFAGDGKLFLQYGDDGLKVSVGALAPGVAPGDVVVLSGSPSVEGGRVILKAKAIEKTGTEPMPEPRAVTASDLTNVGSSRKSVNWLRVTLEGRVLGLIENGFALDVAGVPVNVFCREQPEWLSAAARLHPLVRVTGVVELMLDPSVFLGGDRYVMAVKLNSSRDEVELLADLDYFAARRARLLVRIAVAVCSLLAVVLALFVVQLVRQRRRLFRSPTLMAERKRMADDLHDTIEQHLVGAAEPLRVLVVRELAQHVRRREPHHVIVLQAPDDVADLALRAHEHALGLLEAPHLDHHPRADEMLLDRVVQVVRHALAFRHQRARAEEAAALAHELHDTIEQHLVGAGMMIKIGRLQEAEGVLVRAKREIRDIVWGLKNDDMMRLSPADMLRQLAHDENTKGLCRVDTKLAGLPAQMDAAQMRDLSLIVREAIGNAIKHGGAKKIAISADAAPDGKWLLRVANDGAPFDPETAPGATEGHFGLEGMRQRARRLGAEISFSRRGEWTVLSLGSGEGGNA